MSFHRETQVVYLQGNLFYSRPVDIVSLILTDKNLCAANSFDHLKGLDLMGKLLK